MQGIGILFAGFITIVIATIFKSFFPAPTYAVDPVTSLPPEADYVWRIILMFDAISTVITYYWRLKMPETARYIVLVAQNARQAAQDMSKVLQVEITEEQSTNGSSTGQQFGLFLAEFVCRPGRHLLGTTSTLLLLDIAFYSHNLFQKDIFSAIGWIPKASTMSVLDELLKIACAQSLIALCGTVPGYWSTVALIDKIKRLSIQIIGFFMMTVFMLAPAIPYKHWITPGNQIWFLVINGLTFFSPTFPNSTTFIVPAEIFSARLRSSCHRISAASGKLGAIFGSFGFLYLAQNLDPTKIEQ